MKPPERSKSLPALSAPEAAEKIALHAPKLREFTKQAATALGAWQGANDVIRECARRDLHIESIVQVYMTESVLMAALRIAALFDSNPRQISYQQINRHLKRQDVVQALSERAVYPGGPKTVESHVYLFQQTYGDIDWEAHSRLVRLRNVGIAHLTEQTIAKSITYDELGRFVTRACHLCEDVSMIAEGQNVEADYWVDDWADQAYSFWAGYARRLHEVDLPERKGSPFNPHQE